MKDAEQIPIDVAIWRVCHHHRLLVHSRLDTLGLYRGQDRLISILGKTDGLTHSRISEKMRVSNATVSKMVQRMEQTGFVKRFTDEKDQRISRVFLTDKGREVDEKIKQIFVQIQADEIEGFNEEEIEQLMVYLDRLNQNFLKHIPHHPEKHANKEDKE